MQMVVGWLFEPMTRQEAITRLELAQQFDS